MTEGEGSSLPFLAATIKKQELRIVLNCNAYAPGQFDLPSDVACDSSGIVYVTDYNNDRVQLFSV